jgi:hypothetical protein
MTCPATSPWHLTVPARTHSLARRRVTFGGRKPVPGCRAPYERARTAHQALVLWMRLSSGYSGRMEDPRCAAKELLATPGVELWLLWLRYWANGGSGQEWELDAFIPGLPVLEEYDLKLLGWAVEDLSALI